MVIAIVSFLLVLWLFCLYCLPGITRALRASKREIEQTKKQEQQKKAWDNSVKMLLNNVKYMDPLVNYIKNFMKKKGLKGVISISWQPSDMTIRYYNSHGDVEQHTFYLVDLGLKCPKGSSFDALMNALAIRLGDDYAFVPSRWGESGEAEVVHKNSKSLYHTDLIEPF